MKINKKLFYGTWILRSTNNNKLNNDNTLTYLSIKDESAIKLKTFANYNYVMGLKKSKIAIAAVEGKLTQAQITSEYGVHATQIKAWKQTALKAIEDVFSGAYEKDKKAQKQLVEDLYQEIGRIQAQLSWLKKKYDC